jgi:copper(I)-binding protein
MFRPTLSVSVLFLAMTVSLAAQAQVTVKDAWVRATVPQQKATGAFMQLQSAQDAKLLSAQSPVAGVVEVHEMAMDGGVMKMRAVPSLALPAGKAVEDGKRQSVELKVPARTAAAPAMNHGAGQMHKH